VWRQLPWCYKWSVAEDRDLIDATCVAEVLRAAQRWEAATGKTSPGKPLRETVWFFLAATPAPASAVRSKYPKRAPWTKAAREAYAADTRCFLIIEHVEPIKVLVRRLLGGSPETSDDRARYKAARIDVTSIGPLETGA
jgi:hypothetical protein